MDAAWKSLCFSSSERLEEDDDDEFDDDELLESSSSAFSFAFVLTFAERFALRL
jgi:hypothetical protein